MKFRKLIAMLLLIATLVGSISSCTNRQTTAEDPTDSQTVTNEIPRGDEWMDIWSQESVFTPITDDEKLDTKGETEDGSWFDSFSANKNPFWVNKNGYATKLEMNDGKMYYEAADCTGTHREAVIARQIRQSEQFELEFRFKMDYYGNDNGVYVSFNGVRVIIYFSESWVRFNRDRGGSEPAGDLVYTNIGYDWHTYRIRVVDRVAKVYIDGVYLTSFKPESFGGEMGEIAFIAYPSNAINAAKAQVEYVSYTVLGEDELKITSPKPQAVCGSGKADVEVAVELSSALAAKGDKISYYLNGLYAGDSTAEEGKMTFRNLKAGVYSVYASCGDVTSTERVFIVESEQAKQPLSYTTATQLNSSYVLKFNVNGSGTVTAGDGMFPLSLQFSGAKLQYTAAEGEKNALLGKGAYIAVVDGGVVWLYRDGKQVLSYKLPYGACSKTASVSGSVADLTVEPHNGTYYENDLSGVYTLDQPLNGIGYSYALEFAYTAGNDATVQLTDGIYSTYLKLGEGGISALVSPQKNMQEARICSAQEGTALYRVVVSAGIAQIFANNVWLASWRMPESVAAPCLYVKGNGIGAVQIRETKDKFYFSTSVADGDWNEFFGSSGDPSGIGASCLKVYAKNVEISAEINYTGTTTGEFYLLARYFNNLGLFAGYDFNTKSFKMGLTSASLKVVGSGKKLPADGKATLSVKTLQDRFVLYCNGEKIGELATGSVNGFGNAGYLLRGNASVKSYNLEGDGTVLRDTATSLIPNDGTSCFFEMNGYVYSFGRGTLISKDDGITFESVERFGKNGWNMLLLKSGKVLSLVLEGTASKRRYVAYQCTPKGMVIGGPYPVNGDHELNAYRLSMNGRVMQTSSGRIFFASGETENEYIGQVWVYYSDNEGETWIKAKTEFNQRTTGMNLQEGMIVELDNGVLRMYARNDGGFLVYSDSRDGGVTWDTQMKMSNFPSVICAFGVNKDPYTGDIYMSWEYNNTNDSNLVQYPRTRLALAVSHDNAKTWEYIGVFEDLNSAGSSTWMHMNAGVWFTKDAILATTEKSINGGSYNYIVRIPREHLVSMARNVELHVLRADPFANREGVKLFANGVLAISSQTGSVYASGVNYDISNVNGKRTMISAEIVASFLNGVLTTDGNRAVIRVGTAEYIFEAGSKTASIAGEEKGMTFEAILEDGAVKISLEDLQNTLGLTARCSASGAMVFTINEDPIRLEYLLSMTGIW